MPVQLRAAHLVRNDKVGSYHRLSIVAPEIAKEFRPGHFVAFAVGGAESGLLLRRAFSVHGTGPGGSVEVVLSVTGAGTAWLAERRPGDRVDVIGPLGHPFPLPTEPVRCVLVGGGYGAAPLFSLAAELRRRNCSVHMVLGAASEDRLFGALEAKRLSDSSAVTTDDGSFGVPGRVTEVLDDFLEKADVAYACGPMPMLAAVAGRAAEFDVTAHVAVEEAMACGIGVCMTCVLPVLGNDGVPHLVRSCVEGPVFRGERVLFDAVGTVPAGAI
jgi:dihydroorotate dehydrogenase electron transfer subunit